MADWTDPQTWRDAGKYKSQLAALSKEVTDAKRRGAIHAEVDSVEAIVSVLQGHQASLLDVSQVAGKLVAYTMAAHEQRQREVETLRKVIKSVRQLSNTVNKLTKRIEKLEKRSANRGR